MSKALNVLIIDDHPLIIDSYQRALKQVVLVNNRLKFNIDAANNCDIAMLKLERAKTNGGIDLVFLDMRLPQSKDGSILCGEDLGIKIKNTFKDIKIIVSTTYNNAFKISSVLKNLNPDGFLVKNDITLSVLIDAVNNVVFDPPFYSKTVMKILRKQSANDFIIDSIDRKILYELSNGTKMNELPQILPLSIAALERRKRILKDVFNVVGKGDRDLLLLAEENGFI
ncbi:response regulator [Flavivirga aquimarina]|uniref:Response regulator n=1 Tax=Flavivirga aquimarina TaxID=2027862 RepID=A0ABT8W778_9FLAO|nr:response regulator [Flavivirga aquimarina]MDO5968987.1 response regulator [Flavivirga aquimarina]